MGGSSEDKHRDPDKNPDPEPCCLQISMGAKLFAQTCGSQTSEQGATTWKPMGLSNYL